MFTIIPTGDSFIPLYLPEIDLELPSHKNKAEISKKTATYNWNRPRALASMVYFNAPCLTTCMHGDGALTCTRVDGPICPINTVAMIQY